MMVGEGATRQVMTRGANLKSALGQRHQSTYFINYSTIHFHDGEVLTNSIDTQTRGNGGSREG
jgi:hypothetical protein